VLVRNINFKIGEKSEVADIFDICQFKEIALFHGLGSVVDIATAYGLDDLGIESQWGRDFLLLSRPALRPTQRPVQWVPGLSWG